MVNIDQNDDRKKMLAEYEKEILPILITKPSHIKAGAQTIIDKGKKICEDMSDISDVAEKRLKFIRERKNDILNLDENRWSSFSTTIDKDRSLTVSLNQFDIEINSQMSSLDLMAASASTMVDSSYNVMDNIAISISNGLISTSNTNFLKSYSQNFLEDKTIVRSGFQSLCPEFLDEFNDVIRDWESKKYRDMKQFHGLRMTIFGKLFGLGSQKRLTSEWYEEDVFKNSFPNNAHYDSLTKILFFILEDNDPRKYPDSLITQIVEIAKNLSTLHQQLSEGCKIRDKTLENYELELIFNNTLFYTATAIRLREIIKNNRNYFQFHL